jgi:H+/gluconate symporter-like permease
MGVRGLFESGSILLIALVVAVVGASILGALFIVSCWKRHMRYAEAALPLPNSSFTSPQQEMEEECVPQYTPPPPRVSTNEQPPPYQP